MKKCIKNDPRIKTLLVKVILSVRITFRLQGLMTISYLRVLISESVFNGVERSDHVTLEWCLCYTLPYSLKDRLDLIGL